VKRQRNLEDFGRGLAEVPVFNVSLPAIGRPTFFQIDGKGEVVALEG
jgi:hypothetical protein